MAPQTKKVNETEKTAQVAKPAKIAKTELTAKAIKADLPIKPKKAAKAAELVKPTTMDVTSQAIKTPRTAKMDMTNLKRLPKSLRTNQRRMKQIAHQEGTPFRSLIARHPFNPKEVEALPAPAED